MEDSSIISRVLTDNWQGKLTIKVDIFFHLFSSMCLEECKLQPYANATIPKVMLKKTKKTFELHLKNE